MQNTLFLPLAGHLFQDRPHLLIRQTALILAGTAGLTVMAQISIPLPFTPVPVTGQTLAVLLVGSALGSRLGMLSTLFYLALGCLGFPVFEGASAGIEKIYGPTGGYLLGFLAASYFLGQWAEKGRDRRLSQAWLGYLIALALIFVPGLFWLGLQTEWNHVLTLGLWPFLPGELIKMVIASTVMPTLWRMTAHR